jgi:hypothetical protein
MALRPSAIFFLPNTTTLLARSAINLLKAADQTVLEEAITTLQNRSLSASAVMAHLEQNVNVAEVLERLAKEWTADTLRAFSVAFNMDAAKTDVMDTIVAIAILNEADLEAELRGENTSAATATDLMENRRITWQYPPPGTLLNPPYLVLVAVEQVDTSKADSEVEAILGELVDYKGYKIPKRLKVPFIPIFRPEISSVLVRNPDVLTATAVEQPALSAVAPAAPIAQPVATASLATQPVGEVSNRLALTTAFSRASRISGGF